MTDQPLKPTEYLEFKELPRSVSGKTRQIQVLNRHHGNWLGLMKWHGPWHQYIFEPVQGFSSVVFNNQCLMDIADKLGYLNTMHSAQRSEESKP